LRGRKSFPELASRLVLEQVLGKDKRGACFASFHVAAYLRFLTFGVADGLALLCQDVEIAFSPARGEIEAAAPCSNA
jgi:hypothetical protein